MSSTTLPAGGLSGAAEAGSLLGCQRPRLWSFPPYARSAGPEAIALAEAAGLVLDPWQRWLLYPCLGERPDGKWAAGDVCLIVPRQNGKGGVLEARTLAGLALHSEELIIWTAHEFKTSQEAFRRILALVEGFPDLDRRVVRTPQSHGEEGIELAATRSVITGPGGQQITRGIKPRLRFLARSKSSARGFSADLLIYDEAMVLDAEDVGASRPTLSARRMATPAGQQVWYTGSAGLRISTQQARLRARALAPLSPLATLPKNERDRVYAATLPGSEPESYSGGLDGTDLRLAFAEWSIDPHDEYCPPGCGEHDDRDSLEAVLKSNPAFGIRIFADDVEDERLSMTPEEYGRERLGIGTYPAPGDAWLVLPKAWWDATYAGKGGLERPPQRIFALDTNPVRTATAIGVAGPRSDGRVQLELVDHQPGTRWVVGRARELDDRWRPACWVVDKTAAAGGFITDLEDAGLTVISPTAAEVGYACGDLYDAFRDDKVRHDGADPVRKAFAGAMMRSRTGQWVFDRNSPADLCPAYAMAYAHWGWRRHANEGDYDARASVAFDVTELIRLVKAGIYGPADVERVWSRGLIDDAGLAQLDKAGIPLPAGARAG